MITQFDVENPPSKHRSPMSLNQLRVVMQPLGFITYGGPIAHIGVLRERFKHFTTEEEFQELFTLCQTLPGPTSTQMVIAVGTNLTHSCLGGLVAFLYFSLPSAIVMLICGLYFPKIDNHNFHSLIDGFKFAAIAVILEAAYKLSKGALHNRCHMLLYAVSIVISFTFPSSSSLILLILVGAAVNYVHDRQMNQQSLLQPQEISQELPFQSPFLGKNALIAYAVTFATLFVLSYIRLMPIVVSAGLFKVGSLVIGGGHVVLPMIQMELTDYLTIEQFWNAFAMVSTMPGPMFNIAIYIGALIGGVPVALLAEFFMFLPGFFTIFGLLPYWKQYRSLKIVRSILQGIAAITVGFIISAVLHLIIQSCTNKVVLPLLIAACACAGIYFKIQIPFLILGGGVVNLIFEYQ